MHPLLQHMTSPELQLIWTVWRSAFDKTPQYSLQSQALWFEHSSVDHQVMDQFAQMRTMLSSFLGQKQETTRTAFCNNLVLEVEGLEDKDFQTFRNEAVNFKLLSSILSRTEERGRQPQQRQQQTLL